ncbi:aspartyl-phosphate phosphatase Spo0E family protein [Peribacillus alkalitolerans]|uniref:aspartyl-phosphate phosphatase Spo0E family protein n=1 Tax=Peribacillus alkalitolerans TaxID=1550385 RepID=UPI0013D5D9C1|nr:aspartyl-phosphate phosphatase Spo0E family protein [Peribacillus alkalitolerans]
MPVEMQQLLQNIEEVRERMITLAQKTSLENSKVIQASIELDSLINQYLLMRGKL